MFTHAIFIINQLTVLYDERDRCIMQHWNGWRGVISYDEMMETVKDIDARIENICEQLRMVSNVLDDATKAIKKPHKSRK